MPEASNGWVQDELPFEDQDLYDFLLGVVEMRLEIGGQRLVQDPDGSFRLARVKQIDWLKHTGSENGRSPRPM